MTDMPAWQRQWAWSKSVSAQKGLKPPFCHCISAYDKQRRIKKKKCTFFFSTFCPYFVLAVHPNAPLSIRSRSLFFLVFSLLLAHPLSPALVAWLSSDPLVQQHPSSLTHTRTFSLALSLSRWPLILTQLSSFNTHSNVSVHHHPSLSL